jgi:DNA helicase-2/ATP-dependent DNA helicase PcrA
MSHWSEIRRRARAWRVVLTRKTGGAISADAVLAAAETATGYKRRGLAADHPLLAGAQAVLDMDTRSIWYNADVSPEEARILQAHEYAHLHLHGGHSACRAADINAEAIEEPIPIGIGQVDGYGPAERREREANVFAQEFLLPSDHLRRWFIDEGLRSDVIGMRVGLPQGMVCHQLAYATLVSDLLRASDRLEAPQEPTALVPDQSQIEAAHALGPALIDAGPGTGKTRTLVERILWLLDNGTPAEAILALTFSNKAAEEMRARIMRVAPEDATKMWMGTFHSFGLELIRKYYARLSLPARPAVLAPADSLVLLERDLAALRLDHYQNLYEPTLYLRDILGAISRAKDELIGPEGYMALAGAMLAEATTPEEVEAAEKAQEVARVYASYEELLRMEAALDFGDLITRPVALLQAHHDIRDQLRAAYQQILVDEFQDVNHACGVLLQQITGHGHGLWVVGDVRQSIYRWRGAAPRNVRDFTQMYPSAQIIPLRRNYRAQPRIISSYAAVAPRMRATRGQPFIPWEAHRKDTDAEILMRVAEDGDAEGDGIAREVNRLRAGPARIAYREQAVLCRSHTALARIADRLERAGVPVLYLGDVFERPEVRDLLSLLSLACEGDGRALVRVARFAAYAIPLKDVRMLLQLAQEHDVPFPRALALANDHAGMSPEGIAGFRRLQRDIEGLCHGTTAWGMLSRYLFEKSTYLDPLLSDVSLHARQQRLVLFQILRFAHEQHEVIQPTIGTPQSGSTDAKHAFLRFVRRLALYGDDQQLRQVPEWAADLDAVRLVTIHGAKGLEFRAVYLPYLGMRHFPVPRHWHPCPPPKGLTPDIEADWHSEEEECLFFVALSRARDVLCLSRARRYGKQSSNASSLLLLLAGALPQPIDGPVVWRASMPAQTASPTPQVSRRRQAYEATHLDVYLKCPRQYFYEFRLELRGRREDTAYVRFHRSIYEVLCWMRSQRQAGSSLNTTGVEARLDEIWLRRGPHDHPYGPIYRESASLLLGRAVERFVQINGDISGPTWAIDLSHGRVLVTPDEVEIINGAAGRIVSVRRFRTSRPSSSEANHNVYGLYHRGVETAFPGTTYQVETIYLTTNERKPVLLNPQPIQTRLDRYDEAIKGIEAGEFAPQPDDRECPKCPHYFICPLAEDRLTP